MTGATSDDPFHPSHHLDRIRHLVMAADPSLTPLAVGHLRYRPRRSLLISWTDRPADSGRSTRTVVALVTGRAREHLTEVAAHPDGRRVYTFAPAEDPALRGLASVLDPCRRRQLLATAGLGLHAHSLILRSYRPLRRAVYELTGGPVRLFLKVVRPHRAERIGWVHDRLREAGVPVPPVLADAGDGVLVLGAIPGAPLRAVIADGGRLPGPADLVGLLDSLPAALLDVERRHRPCERAVRHAAWLTAVDPQFEYALDLARAIVAVTDAVEDGPIVPVHGDVYEKNLLVDGGRIVGVVDLDRAGPGRRIDDYATMVGHLGVLAQRRSHGRAAPLGAALLGHLDRATSIERRLLRVHVAAVILGLATGSYRVQETGWAANTHARLALARRWLSSADAGASRISTMGLG